MPDACALLNLHHGGVLQAALALPDSSFAVGKAVYGEASSLTEELDRLIAAAELAWLDDASIPASEFLRLKDELDLGDGETECIAAALQLDCRLVFDDMAARRAAIQLIGQARVTGSIGLLRACVATGGLDAPEAYAAYELMKAVGAYLPIMSIDDMFPPN